MRIRWKAGLWILVLFLLCVPEGFAWTWPDTGQTKCYDNTVEIPCPEPGQPFYGQDAQYQGPTRSYTKLGQNGVVLADTATQESGWVTPAVGPTISMAGAFFLLYFLLYAGKINHFIIF